MNDGKGVSTIVFILLLFIFFSYWPIIVGFLVVLAIIWLILNTFWRKTTPKPADDVAFDGHYWEYKYLEHAGQWGYKCFDCGKEDI